MRISEEEIVRKFMSDTAYKEGYTLMVRCYKESLYALIRRFVGTHTDTDDVLQNVFLKAWSRRETYRGESKLLTWLSRIAINESLTWMQSRNKYLSREDSTLDSLDLERSDLLDQSQRVDYERAQRDMDSALRTLTYRQRAVFCMHYYEDLTYEEMAELLGSAVGTLKATYFVARHRVEEYLRKQLL